MAYIGIVPFTLSQRVQWAQSIKEKSTLYTTRYNFPELVLGPPSIYPDSNYNTPYPDLYADGYVCISDRNKREILEVAYKRPMPSNLLLLCGVINENAIKSVHLVLKDNKYVKVYISKSSDNMHKVPKISIPFKLETVYGARIEIDHTKITNWNIIKGIGLANSKDSVFTIPELYPQDEFPFAKDTISHTINTKECFEFNPRLTPDGSTMYFVKECPGTDDQDIWISETDAAGRWLEAKPVGNSLNNEGHNFVTSISLDGKKLYIGNTYLPNGKQLGPGLSVSVLQKNKKWSIPENIEIPGLNNRHAYANYFMSLDGKAILIAMENEQSLGDLDLYVSLFNKYKKKFDEPIHLGADINTPYAEDFPYLAFDGKTLYFSSKGRIGYGGHDIYMSRRLDDSWQKWSKPVNLGPKVNSKTDDNGFIISNSGDYAYFNSVSFDTIHNMDIFRIKLPVKLRQQPQVLVQGKITSMRDQRPLAAHIRYKIAGSRNFEPLVTEANDDGSFSFILPFGNTYVVDVELPGYFKTVDHIALTDTTHKQRITRKYQLEPYLDSGQVSVIGDLHFEYGKATLKDTSLMQLDDIASRLKQQNHSVVEIAGHTDDIGSEEYNMILSQQRATAVVEYLIKKGIRPWRLKAKGYGESVPLASNETADGRALNRRVEMIVLEEDFTKKYQKNKPEPKKQRFNFYNSLSKN